MREGMLYRKNDPTCIEVIFYLCDLDSLCDLAVVSVQTKLSLDGIEIRRGDFVESQVDLTIESPETPHYLHALPLQTAWEACQYGSTQRSAAQIVVSIRW
jgi:hypothetical protein